MRDNFYRNEFRRKDQKMHERIKKLNAEKDRLNSQILELNSERMAADFSAAERLVMHAQITAMCELRDMYRQLVELATARLVEA